MHHHWPPRWEATEHRLVTIKPLDCSENWYWSHVWNLNDWKWLHVGSISGWPTEDCKTHIKSAPWDVPNGILESWWGFSVGKVPDILLEYQNISTLREKAPAHSRLATPHWAMGWMASKFFRVILPAEAWSDGVIELAGIGGWDYEARYWRWGWRQGPLSQQTLWWQFWSRLDFLATSLFQVVRELDVLFVLYWDVLLLPVFPSPLGMNLSDYSLNSDETKRDFKDSFLWPCLFPLFFVHLDAVHGEGMGESLDINYSFCVSILNSRFQQGVWGRAAWSVKARMGNRTEVSSRESRNNEIWVCRPLSSLTCTPSTETMLGWP